MKFKLQKIIIMRYILPFLNLYDKKVIIFQPDNIWRKLWDFIDLIMLIIFCIFLPFKIGFFNHEKIEKSNNYNCSLLFYFIPNIFFLIDILININTAIYHHGALITKKITIFKNYLNNEFFIDFFSFIPILLNLWFDLKDFDIIGIFRLIKMFKQFKKMEIFLQMSEKSQGNKNLLYIFFYKLNLN